MFAIGDLDLYQAMDIVQIRQFEGILVEEDQTSHMMLGLTNPKPFLDSRMTGCL